VALGFEKIYNEHFSGVYKYVLSLSRDESVTEEITQETFFKAMQSMDKFNGSCTLYVWLCQIAKNTYFSLYQKRKRYASSDDTELPSDLDIEANFLDKDTTRRLHVLLHNLSEPYKEVFTLRVFGELPFSQIGELFGKTDSWARLIFYRAKNKLVVQART
jgi:RNA polymerase sigma-70 factor (ECF subfamily)